MYIRDFFRWWFKEGGLRVAISNWLFMMSARGYQHARRWNDGEEIILEA